MYINLHTKKQHVFLLRNDDSYSIYTFQIKSNWFDLKSANHQFFCFVNF